MKYIIHIMIIVILSISVSNSAELKWKKPYGYVIKESGRYFYLSVDHEENVHFILNRKPGGHICLDKDGNQVYRWNKFPVGTYIDKWGYQYPLTFDAYYFPVIVNNHLLFSGFKELEAETTPSIMQISADTLDWITKLAAPTFDGLPSSPFSDGNFIYVIADYFKTIFKLDFDGHILSKYSLSNFGGADTNNYYAGITEKAVFLLHNDFSSNTLGLYCFDTALNLNWVINEYIPGRSITVDSQENVYIPCNVHIENMTWNEYLICYHNSAESWRIKSPNDDPFINTVIGKSSNLLFTAAGNKIYQISTDGSILNSFTMPADITAPIMVSNTGLIYAVCADRTLYAIPNFLDTILWSFKTAGVVESPSLTMTNSGLLYVADVEYLYAIQTTDTGLDECIWPKEHGNAYNTGFSLVDKASLIQNNFNLIPNEYNMVKSYPNPFNNSTTIIINMAKDAQAKVEIHNINGRLVKQLLNGRILQGETKFTWQAQNQATGIYFVVVNTPASQTVHKMLYLK